jgi:hypothetical protein
MSYLVNYICFVNPFILLTYTRSFKFKKIVALRGVMEDLSALRDRGPGLKTGSRPLTFTKAVTDFSEPHTLWCSHCANEILLNSVMQKMLKQLY